MLRTGLLDRTISERVRAMPKRPSPSVLRPMVEAAKGNFYRQHHLPQGYLDRLDRLCCLPIEIAKLGEQRVDSWVSGLVFAHGKKYLDRTLYF